ncbi:MAG TPA: cupin domain-containing protein [Syntrophorhabdaceae bacterium]|nr:cupin domain-containing protein [Syntrophorhabdaceae bacterium]HPP06102.1 cupin domain-containing protein [Syntrophorhabdaceae bacterium]
MKKGFLIICIFILCAGSFCFAVEDGVDVKIITKTGYSWDGKSLPVYSAKKPEITILKITIPPGVTLPMHRHPVINAGYMIKGKLSVYTENGSMLSLKEGDSIVEVVDTWHYGKNEGNVPAVIIVFYAGYEAEPITIYKK